MTECWYLALAVQGLSFEQIQPLFLCPVHQRMNLDYFCGVVPLDTDALREVSYCHLERKLLRKSCFITFILLSFRFCVYSHKTRSERRKSASENLTQQISKLNCILNLCVGIEWRCRPFFGHSFYGLLRSSSWIFCSIGLCWIYFFRYPNPHSGMMSCGFLNSLEGFLIYRVP